MLEQTAAYIWSLFGERVVLPFLFWTAFGGIMLALGLQAMRWNRESLKSAGLNMGLMVFNSVFIVITAVAIEWTQDQYAALGVPSLPAEIWDGVWLIWPVLATVFLIDFVNYWHHRLMHTKWYWPVHAVHHSDRHMNFTTLFRIHFLEGIAMKLAAILFLSWFQVPGEAYAIAALLNMLVGQYIHLDIPISHGKLGDKIIASPQVHRWHHANAPEAFGKNLANFFSCFDVMFGTYYNPGPCNAPLGITPDPGQGLPANLMLPFTEWKRLVEESRKDAASTPDGSTVSV